MYQWCSQRWHHPSSLVCQTDVVFWPGPVLEAVVPSSMCATQMAGGLHWQPHRRHMMPVVVSLGMPPGVVVVLGHVMAPASKIRIHMWLGLGVAWEVAALQVHQVAVVRRLGLGLGTLQVAAWLPVVPARGVVAYQAALGLHVALAWEVVAYQLQVAVVLRLQVVGAAHHWQAALALHVVVAWELMA